VVEMDNNITSNNSTLIKLNMEIKVSRNFNTVTIGVQDEPVRTDKIRIDVQSKFKILREEALRQLDLIGDVEK
jgi:hypothetical protein